jgi:alanyl aminopeptidase
LARRWLEDRGGIDPMMVAAVLDTAARHADAALFEELEIGLVASQSSRDRRQLLWALAKVREPALRARALAMSVGKVQGVDRMAGRDALAFLEEALEDDWNRRAAFAFVRENFDAIAAKLPPETPGQLVTPLERLCTPEDREPLVAFFRDRAGKFLRGQRKYVQAVEAVGICIAAVPR